MNTNSLVPVSAGASLAKFDQEGINNRDERAQRLFSQFRRAFDASKAVGRLIFWREVSNGRSVLRCVTKLERKSKQDDQILGIVRGGIPAEPLLVGNLAADRSMTLYRWEIYNDFRLQDLWRMGRFDVPDLLGHLSEVDIGRCRSQNLAPGNDWDFDNLALYHRCLKCGGVFDRQSVIFLHQKKCESCGQSYNLSDVLRVIDRLRLKEKRPLAIFSVTERPDFPIQAFLDPVSNSVMYWWIGQNRDWFFHNTSKPSIDQEDYRHMLQSSIFGLTLIEACRPGFERYVKEVFPDPNDDLPILCYQLPRMGRYLAHYPASAKEDEFIGTASEIIRAALPSFINAVILHQPDQSEDRRLQLLELAQ